MRFRKPEEEEIQVGLAPLIDIVFLLLIFFMLTSHFDVASGVLIRLPKMAQKVQALDEKKITVVIDSQGNPHLEGKQMDLGKLSERLREIVNREGVVNLILQADEDARHGKVVRVMDLAKAAGVRTIIIAARWAPEKVF
jgi:biopolymer transport protein ExbD